LEAIALKYLIGASAWVGHNTLALINLVAFLFSVVLLWKTMRAGERQTERTSKPVICLRRENFNPSDRELLEPQVNVVALIPFEMRNVGNGTALAIHWRFKAGNNPRYDPESPIRALYEYWLETGPTRPHGRSIS
jgi:hypothetical protein